LRLKTGTKLKCIPRLLGATRILITITAGEAVGSKPQKLPLTFHDSDSEKGLYYDRSSYQLEDEIKQGLVDEVLDVNFRGRDLIKKGVAIARKYKDMYIKGNKIVWVSITAKEAKDG
jgi:hypothetical protein